MGQSGFWDVEERYQKLKGKKDFLCYLDEVVPWESFRELLEQIHDKPRKSNAGRRPIDAVLMFKLLVLQKMYNIGDDELEYQVNDRLSFMRFLHLGIEDAVPDAKTIWSFRTQLGEQGLIEALFEQFSHYLSAEGYQAQCGQIIDATLVPVPKPHNRRKENAQLKRGEVPDDWKAQPNKLAQKDVDARWTKKNGVSHYGYKNHISTDVGYGFIRYYAITDASVHDSRVLGALLDADNTDDDIWADSAYFSKAVQSALYWMGFISHIHERAYRNRPLSETQKANNTERSRTRAKVEHVFGTMVTSMGGKAINSIGMAGAKVNLGLKNLTFNLQRYVFWQKQELLEAVH